MFFGGAYLRAVSFGVTLHILHGCQCVKASNNPAAEGQGTCECAQRRAPQRPCPRSMPGRGGESGRRLQAHEVPTQAKDTDRLDSDRPTGWDRALGLERKPSWLAVFYWDPAHPLLPHCGCFSATTTELRSVTETTGPQSWKYPLGLHRKSLLTPGREVGERRQRRRGIQDRSKESPRG